MKALCFALFACAFNLLIGFGGLLSFGHAMFLGTAGYVCAHAAKEWGWPPELAILAGTAASALLGHRRGRARDPAAGHLFRDDHAGARADDLLLLSAGAVHARRGRHPGGAARQALRRSSTCRTRSSCTTSCWRSSSPRSCLIYRDRAFAVRPGAEGDPRKRAARDLARLRRRAVQAARVRPVGHAVGTRRRRSKAIVFQLASLTDVHWTMSGEVVLMTLLGGMGTIFGPVVGAFAIIGLESYLARIRPVGHGHHRRRSSSSACSRSAAASSASSARGGRSRKR